MLIENIQSVKQLIDERALNFPEKVFLHVAETEQTLSYRELQKNCQKVETLLDRKGIKASETVAFLMDNGLWTSCLFLGIMYSGRVVLPLNAVAGLDQLLYTVEHSELKLVFCSEKYQQQYQNLLSQQNQKKLSFDVIQSDEDSGPIDISVDISIDEVEVNANKKTENQKTDCQKATSQSVTNQNNRAANDIALMIYTSGTTGRPKGVLLSHQNVLAGGNNTVQAHRLKGDDVSLCVLPLYHINAEMVSIMAPLISAGSVVMPHKLSISQFWHWIADFRCTWFSAVPTIYSYLLEHQQRISHEGYGQEKDQHEGLLKRIDFKSISKHVRFGRSASAALSPAVHEEFESIFGINIIETMGISECAAQILSNPVLRQVDYYGSPGVPIGNEMRIVDSAHKTLADNDIGEIAVRGSNIMVGYFKNPETTNEALDDDGWFYTGDLGYRNEDGYFFVTGRSKELIIRGGENIAPREIDDVLYKRNEILEAAAFGMSSDYYGQEVFACVSLKPGKQCSEEELLEHCQELLGQIKSPKRIHIIDELPKGPSGKIQRLKLADRIFQ